MAAASQQRVDHFPGYPKLRNAGAIIEYTPEEILELSKCVEDPIYFIKTYCKIVHVDHGLIPFNVFPYQERVVTKILDNHDVIMKYPRQSGKTTIVAAVLLWLILFNKHYNIGCLAHKESQAQEILARTKLMFEHLPMWLQQGVVAWNKKSIELENGSKITAAATSSGSIRGQTLNFIYLDEFAHIPMALAEDFYTSVLPTISSGETTKIVISSTPLGFNLFYKIWHDSIEGENEYVREEIHYSETPGRDEEWAAEQRKRIGPVRFEQEFGCVTGDTVVTVRDSRSGYVFNGPIKDLYEWLQ